MSTEAPTEAPRRRLGNLALVWDHARRYPGRIAAAGAALTVTSLATIAIPYSFKRVIDRGFGPGAQQGDMASAFHYLLMIVLVLAVATAIRFYSVSWLGERVVADIRARVQRHLLTLTPRFFEENRPSEIASRLTADTAQIENVVGSTMSVALRNVFTGIGGMIYLFAISPKLAGMLVLGIPVVILPIALLGRRVRAYSRHSQDRIADVGAMATETLGAMKIVQAFGQEEREAQRFAEAVEATMAAARRRILVRAVMTAIVIGLIFGSITMVLWEGAIDVAAGRLSGGAIAAFVLTGGIVAGAFGALTEVYGDLLRGAGKTTLFQLLQRFYDPQGGRITIDGIDLRDTDPAAIRSHIAMVPQETVIFAASARDNLRYGRWEAGDDELWAAAEAANAADFLRALPEGLDTYLGEGGARLSGGQRQRVAIARALLRDAPILLLDEATSALDAESELLVQQALDRLMTDRTTLVIAHRLATVRAAHRIVVMDDGRIVEEGTHATLISRGGLYARLASLQFSEAA